MNMGDYAKFNATLAKVTVNGKKAQVLLEMNHKDLEKHYLTLVSSIDEEIIVQLGNPQVSMEDLGVSVPRPGVTAKVDSSGVVESVDNGENDLLDPRPEVDDVLTFDNSEDSKEEPPEPNAEQEEGDNPEDEQSEQLDGGGQEGGSNEFSGAKDDKEALEQYILDRRPHFEDLPYDFPTLLARKRTGETWLKISSSIGVTSGTLSTAWGKYKEKVRDLLA
jgi:hypothetical protein